VTVDSSEIIAALQAAGIIPAGPTRRVVVDLRDGWEPVIHLEMSGDRRTIELVQYLDGVAVGSGFRGEVRDRAPMRPESAPEPL
jgi:hypothetical protein